MTCSRCFKRIKVGYWHNGHAYGPECVIKVGGYAKKSKMIKINDAEKDDIQEDFFK